MPENLAAFSQGPGSRGPGWYTARMRQGIGGEILRWAGSVEMRSNSGWLGWLWGLFSVLAIFTLTLVMKGCGTYTPPALGLESARVVESTPAGKVIQFELSAKNVNSQALPLRDVRYDVYVNGDKVFEGRRSAEATLRAFGTQTLVLPAAVAAGTPLPSGDANVEIRGELVYQTPGIFADILFDNELRTPTVGFDGATTIALP